MKKTCFILALVFVLSVVLAACGNGTTPPAADAAAAAFGDPAQLTNETVLGGITVKHPVEWTKSDPMPETDLTCDSASFSVLVTPNPDGLTPAQQFEKLKPGLALLSDDAKFSPISEINTLGYDSVEFQVDASSRPAKINYRIVDLGNGNLLTITYGGLSNEFDALVPVCEEMILNLDLSGVAGDAAEAGQSDDAAAPADDAEAPADASAADDDAAAAGIPADDTAAPVPAEESEAPAA